MNFTQFNKALERLSREIETKGYRENMGQKELRQHEDWLRSEMTDGKINYQAFDTYCNRAINQIDAL